MWTLMVVVAIGGRGVDANLIILQVIGSPESRFFTCSSLPLAPASRPRVPEASNRYRRVVGGSWDVWRCRIAQGNAVTRCNCRGSSWRVRREPGGFGRFKRVLRSVSSDLDTLTLVFELNVRLRERRQWDSDTCVCL
ncbi:hypothetical protein Taro_044523 [Colocasia esculenta]|uniref:Secreted protein n=1 Tax=Colocasia esculenta TaxID=4460 RepID=A0A843WJE1_COLES|nr:hypothetical protein [Colocasia esculenta]